MNNLKKKVLTLSTLTLLTVSMLLASINLPISAQPPINLHGPSVGPIHMHNTESLAPIHMNSEMELTPIHMHCRSPWISPYEPIFVPWDTEWHQLYPRMCPMWLFTSWIDNGDDYLSANDQIDMLNYDNQTTTWFHVDRMTWTLHLMNETMDEMYIEFKGPPGWNPTLPPEGTLWHEVWPNYCNTYTIFMWMDTGDPTGLLSFCDWIDLGPGGFWHVEEIEVDMILREKIMDPIGTLWHEIHPNYCEWRYLTSWEEEPQDLYPAQLSPGDQIDMLSESHETTWYYVDRMTLTLNVSKESNGEWMKIEMKTYEFEEMYNGLKHPIGTRWHEVYPNYCNVYNLTAWDWYLDDNCNGVLDYCDHIWLYNETSGLEEYYHVEGVYYDLILNEKIMDPIGTRWHELYPDYCTYHTVTSWEEEPDDLYPGRLSPRDQIDMYDESLDKTRWYFVDRVTLTLNVTQVAAPGEYYFFEYKGPFEGLYDIKVDPLGSFWHMVWPTYMEGAFEITYWEDNCNGVLDYCDYIVLEGELCHVEDLAIDIILNEKPTDLVDTWWHELYPDCCFWDYQVLAWLDNGDAILSHCDYVLMQQSPGGYTASYHVTMVTLTLELYVDPLDWMVSRPYPPDGTIFVEYLIPTDGSMWDPKIDPITAEWHEVCPEFSWIWLLTWLDDNCNGVLSYCDMIEMWEPTGLGSFIAHVEDVAVDMEVVESPTCLIDVSDVVPSTHKTYKSSPGCSPVTINVTVRNIGSTPTDNTVNAYYDDGSTWVQIGVSQTTGVLSPMTSVTLTFLWDLTSVPYCNRTIKANATALCGSSDEEINGDVWVLMPGDAEHYTDYGKIGYKDLGLIAAAYGTVPGDAHWNKDCDFDCDDKIGYKDLGLLAANYGTTYTCT